MAEQERTVRLGGQQYRLVDEYTPTSADEDQLLIDLDDSQPTLASSSLACPPSSVFRHQSQEGQDRNPFSDETTHQEAAAANYDRNPFRGSTIQEEASPAENYPPARQTTSS